MALSKGLKKWLRNWHRRFGVVVAVFVIVLSITGVFLNHTEQLGLDQKTIRSPILLKLYGIAMPNIISFQAGELWFSDLGLSHVYRNTHKLAECQSPLLGVEQFEAYIIVACSDRLLQLTPQGQLVDNINHVYGLPMPLKALGRFNNLPAVYNGTVWFAVDVEALTFTVVDGAITQGSSPKPVPMELKQSLISHYQGADITLERAVLDLHSGRLFGRIAAYWVDIVAIALVFLSISGIVMWQQRR